MQSGYTGHVTPSEWRWVIWVGCVLIVFAFIPFLWVILGGVAGTRWEFFGALHDYQNGASDLAKVFQGSQGYLISRYLQTPEAQPGTLFDFIYVLIGQLSRFTFIPGVILFHIARVAASLFMYLALYHLAACVWMRVRTRRIFFLLVVGGAGFGWLLAPITNDPSYLDLTAPEVFPFYATLVNVHYPLAIGCLALVASIIIPVFRPGMSNEAGVQNEALILFVMGLLLSFLYPQALPALMLSFLLLIGVRWYTRKALIPRDGWWLTWFIVPTLPMLVYYGALLAYRPVIAEIWAQQNSVSAPPIPILVASLGVPLLIALPGIWRAVRYFEPDGDQFMLIWLFMMVFLAYFTPSIQRRFLIGLMIPLTYFATRALEDFWFHLVNRRWRLRLFAAMLPVIAASLIFVLFLPTFPILSDSLNKASGMLLESDYTQAFRWLRQRGASGEIVLAAPNTSTWIPATTGLRVVYGHPTDTLQPDIKRMQLIAWYNADDLENCDDLLQGDYTFSNGYMVRYVLIGPQERALGTTVCDTMLEPLETFGDVELYLYTPPIISIP
ncbi:MAG: hypothetical protein RLP44_25970 [Aggregatilineales bacterium]